MTKCACPEQECPNKDHPKGRACPAEPPVIRGREILAGWAGRGENALCPVCQPHVLRALRRGDQIVERVQKRVFGPGAKGSG